MPNEVLLWILGGFAAVFSAVTFAGVKSHTDLRERVIRLEAVMALFGQKAAKILHSPHDPYGIDHLLDKYLDQNYELTSDEWTILWHQCEMIENDKERSKGERTLAAFLSAISRHCLTKIPKNNKGDTDFLKKMQLSKTLQQL